jgi:Flp pilus assembly pilin Flp
MEWPSTVALAAWSDNDRVADDRWYPHRDCDLLSRHIPERGALLLTRHHSLGPDGGAMTMRARRRAGEQGQTTTEYLMIAGLLTAIIISLTKIIVPTMAWVVVKLVNHMAIGISSV